MKKSFSRHLLSIFLSFLPHVACIAYTAYMLYMPCLLQAQQTQDLQFKSLDMLCIIDSPSSFTIGEDVQSITAKRQVEPFYMNKYETTYDLWYSVLQQAQKSGYIFASPGQEGKNGRYGWKPTAQGKYQPVTQISWYDAVVWCNALSEQEGRLPCYTYRGKVLRDSTDTASLDLCVCNFSSQGYRLPSETEWEFAARYSTKGMARGDLASGQKEGQSQSDVAWSNSNTDTTQIVGTAGTSCEKFSSDMTVQAGSGNANDAGLFDMSGNVMEFCWDWNALYEEQEPQKPYIGPKTGYQRINRGGSFSPYTLFLYAADRYGFDPNERYNYLGFRIASSKE